MICKDITEIPSLSAAYIGETLYIKYNGEIISVIIPSGGRTTTLDIENITVPITTDGQVFFSNVIPEDSELLEITVNGITHYTSEDPNESSYTVVNRNITWTGSYQLKTIYTLILKIVKDGGN